MNLAKCFMTVTTASAVKLSRPLVGSSRSRMWGLRTLYAMGMQIVPGMRVCKRHKDMGRKVTHGRAGQVCMVVCGSKADIRGQGGRTLGPWGG